MGQTSSSQSVCSTTDTTCSNQPQFSTQIPPPTVLSRAIFSTILNSSNKSLLDHYQYAISTTEASIWDVPAGFRLMDLTLKRPDLDDILTDLNLSPFPLLPSYQTHNTIQLSSDNQNQNDMTQFDLNSFILHALPSMYIYAQLYLLHLAQQQIFSLPSTSSPQMNFNVPVPKFPLSLAEHHMIMLFDIIQTSQSHVQINHIIRKRNRYKNIVPNEAYRVPISIQNVSKVVQQCQRYELFYHANTTHQSLDPTNHLNQSLHPAHCFNQGSYHIHCLDQLLYPITDPNLHSNYYTHNRSTKKKHFFVGKHGTGIAEDINTDNSSCRSIKTYYDGENHNKINQNYPTTTTTNNNNNNNDNNNNNNDNLPSTALASPSPINNSLGNSHHPQLCNHNSNSRIIPPDPINRHQPPPRPLVPTAQIFSHDHHNKRFDLFNSSQQTMAASLSPTASFHSSQSYYPFSGTNTHNTNITNNFIPTSHIHENDYINASDIIPIIPFTERTFIATQAPMAGTMSDMWQLIWEQGVSSVVMLTNFNELKFNQKVEKSLPYWPIAPGGGHYSQVTLDSGNKNKDNHHYYHQNHLIAHPSNESKQSDPRHFLNIDIPTTQVGYSMYIPYIPTGSNQNNNPLNSPTRGHKRPPSAQPSIRSGIHSTIDHIPGQNSIYSTTCAKNHESFFSPCDNHHKRDKPTDQTNLSNQVYSSHFTSLSAHTLLPLSPNTSQPPSTTIVPNTTTTSASNRTNNFIHPNIDVNAPYNVPPHSTTSDNNYPRTNQIDMNTGDNHLETTQPTRLNINLSPISITSSPPQYTSFIQSENNQNTNSQSNHINSKLNIARLQHYSSDQSTPALNNATMIATTIHDMTSNTTNTSADISSDVVKTPNSSINRLDIEKQNQANHVILTQHNDHAISTKIDSGSTQQSNVEHSIQSNTSSPTPLPATNNFLDTLSPTAHLIQDNQCTQPLSPQPISTVASLNDLFPKGSPLSITDNISPSNISTISNQQQDQQQDQQQHKHQVPQQKQNPPQQPSTPFVFNPIKIQPQSSRQQHSRPTSSLNHIGTRLNHTNAKYQNSSIDSVYPNYLNVNNNYQNNIYNNHNHQINNGNLLSTHNNNNRSNNIHFNYNISNHYNPIISQHHNQIISLASPSLVTNPVCTPIISSTCSYTSKNAAASVKSGKSIHKNRRINKVNNSSKCNQNQYNDNIDTTSHRSRITTKSKSINNLSINPLIQGSLYVVTTSVEALPHISATKYTFLLQYLDETNTSIPKSFINQSDMLQNRHYDIDNPHQQLSNPKINTDSHSSPPSTTGSLHTSTKHCDTNQNNLYTRHVTILHYHGWSDHSVPTISSFANFFDYYRTNIVAKTPITSPIIVSCSAGVGRTGTFLAIDMMVDYLQGFIKQEMKAYYQYQQQQKQQQPRSKKQTQQKQSTNSLWNQLFKNIEKHSHHKETSTMASVFMQYEPYLSRCNPDITLITRIIAGLRVNRPDMVQNSQQYVFVYDFIMSWYRTMLSNLLLKDLTAHFTNPSVNIQ